MGGAQSLLRLLRLLLILPVRLAPLILSPEPCRQPRQGAIRGHQTELVLLGLLELFRPGEGHEIRRHGVVAEVVFKRVRSRRQRRGIALQELEVASLGTSEALGPPVLCVGAPWVRARTRGGGGVGVRGGAVVVVVVSRMIRESCYYVHAFCCRSSSLRACILLRLLKSLRADCVLEGMGLCMEEGEGVKNKRVS